MATTPLQIPTDLLVAADLTTEEARLAMALGLFHIGKLSHDQAKELSGDPARFDASLFPQRDQLDLNDFLDWGSHDLKTPLNLVIGFSKVVLNGIDGPINETQQTDLSSVYDNGQRLLTHLSMLVDIARLNKGGVHLSASRTDLGKLLQGAIARWTAQNPARALETDLHLGSGMLQLDPARTKQLLAGTLSYAALKVPEGGTVHLAASEAADRVTISIESRGGRNPALPELDLVMLRFINRALVRLHGGDLEETVHPEGGVTIQFWLPKE